MNFPRKKSKEDIQSAYNFPEFDGKNWPIVTDNLVEKIYGRTIYLSVCLVLSQRTIILERIAYLKSKYIEEYIFCIFFEMIAIRSFIEVNVVNKFQYTFRLFKYTFLSIVNSEGMSFVLDHSLY